jgi:macrolide-specific efflux system membrane fusion protein
MSALKKTSWWLGWKFWLILVLAAAAGWGIKVKWFSAAEQPQVITAKVEVGDLEDTVLASGTIEAVKQVSVGAQVSGQIKKLHVQLGDTVHQGDLIAEIDSTNQNNTLRNAQAQVALLTAQHHAKEATLHQVELAYKRQKDLLAQDASAKAEFESAEATLAVTRAEIAALAAQMQQAQISVDTARVNLGYTRITAPMDGVVVAVIAEEGRTVNANQSAPTIIKLAKLDTVQIKAQISEADVVRIKPGLPVYFTILGEPNHRYEARLRAVEPAPESEQTESTSTTSSSSSSTAAIYYNGLFDVPNPDQKLRIAMTAQVFVVLAKAENALIIPATALGDRVSGGKRGNGSGKAASGAAKGKGQAQGNGGASRNQTYSVRVREGVGADQKVVTRQVHIGLNNRVQAQVLDGLKEGDEVVVGEAAAGATGSGSTRRAPGMF